MEFELAVPDLSGYAKGNTRTEGVWQFDSGVQGLNVLITALLHGNELCGAWALINLLKAKVRPSKGKLSLIFCNFAAFNHFYVKSHDSSRFVDEDMNRVWCDAKLSEPNSQERRRALELRPFVEQADWLLDLHSMHESGSPLLLTGMQPRNLRLAFAMGSPAHIVVDAGHKDGVRMRDYGRFSDPDLDRNGRYNGLLADQAHALLVECGFHGDKASLDVAMDAVARFLHHSGSVCPEDLPPYRQALASVKQQAVEVTHAVIAQSQSLIFSEDWRGLQCVPRAGTQLASDGGTVHVTPYDHCTLIMPSLRQLRAGTTVMRLARQVKD